MYEYQLIRKKIKNINLRVKADGKIVVSASPYVPKSVIDQFVESKYDFIKRAVERMEKKQSEKVMAEPAPNWSRRKKLSYLSRICQDIYPSFSVLGISYPEIRMRKMKSCWGTCNSQRKIVTLNEKLLQVPRDCASYVAIHEFCHLLVPNHSSEFHLLMTRMCPEWKELKKKLNGYKFPEE